jgi:hypothetical protein
MLDNDDLKDERLSRALAEALGATGAPDAWGRDALRIPARSHGSDSLHSFLLSMRSGPWRGAIPQIVGLAVIVGLNLAGLWFKGSPSLPPGVAAPAWSGTLLHGILGPTGLITPALLLLLTDAAQGFRTFRS